MPFVDEKIEKEIVKAFARMTAVREKDVKYDVVDTLEQQQITMKSNTVLRDETRETEIVIKGTGKNQFEVIGKVTSSAGKTYQINKKFIGQPRTLPKLLSKLVQEAQVKTGFLKRAT